MNDCRNWKTLQEQLGQVKELRLGELELIPGLGRTSISKEQAARLKFLLGLKELNLTNTTLEDGVMSQVAQVSKLSWLDLSNSRFCW
jgi:hypothetical protein